MLIIKKKKQVNSVTSRHCPNCPRESILKLGESESRFEKANIVNVTIYRAQIPLEKKLIEKIKNLKSFEIIS